MASKNQEKPKTKIDDIKLEIAKQKKAEADLEAASTALREANAAAAKAIARLAEVEEENRRLREQTKGTDNVSPNYRALWVPPELPEKPDQPVGLFRA